MSPPAPPVVAVVTVCDAGPWLEEALAALGEQDYPNMSVLVLYPASTVDPTSRVDAVLPGAFVRRVDRNDGYAATTNHVLEMIEGASHFLLCHDDVAPDGGAVRLMVEEAFRSNAGVVCPKLVAWDAPDRLLQVGMTADKSGAPSALAERGELDQEQYDAVRDVFVAPGGCTLVRADLLAALGGLDGAMAHYGEDLDMSWRAQTAGARVVVAPEARVRHLEAASRGRRPVGAADAVGVSAEALRRRHQLRTALKGYGVWHLARVLPQLLVLSGAEVVLALFTGRLATARAVVGAGTWNLGDLGALRAGRRQVRSHRALPDSEVRRLQARGSARASAFLRGQLGPDRARTLGLRARPAPEASAAADGEEVGMDGREPVRAGPRLPAVVWGAVALVLLAGSRHLLGSRLPALGQLAAFPRPSTLLRLFAGGWRTTGLGAEAPAPWMLARLLRVTGTPPYDGGPPPSLVYDALGLGVLVTLAAAFAPVAALVPLLVAAGLVGGAALAGRPRPAARAVAVAVGAGGLAAVLSFPWTLDFVLPGAHLSSLAGVQGPLRDALRLGAVLRFQTGPLGAAPLGWAPLVAAVLPLLVGRAWRLRRAVELWGVAAVCWGVVWAAGRGWLPPVGAVPEVLLAPAAAALALAAALGLVAFEVDLPGYRFGWRQVVSLAAAGAACLAALPVLQAGAGGRWKAPVHDLAGVLDWMPDKRRDGDFRVLWLGDARAIPLAGWSLGAGMAYATSVGGPPDLAAQWPHADPGSTSLLADAVGVAVSGRTTRLGHLLAPMGVRYVVMPSRAAPAREQTPLLAPPAPLTDALLDQVDLRQLDSDGALTVYENVAWAPTRAAIDAAAAAAGTRGGLVAAQGAELSGATPVLGRGRGPTTFAGQVPAGTVEVAEAASDRWSLRVNGRPAPRRTAFGWANSFAVGQPGRATLSYRSSPTRRGALVLEAIFWSLALHRLFTLWRSRRAALPGPTRTPVLPPPPPAPVGAGAASGWRC